MILGPLEKARPFDYDGVIRQMIESIMYPFRSNMEVMFMANINVDTLETVVLFHNFPSLDYVVVKDRLFYTDMRPEEACSFIANEFRIKLEHSRASCDIPDTIELGEN